MFFVINKNKTLVYDFKAVNTSFLNSSFCIFINYINQECTYERNSI